MRRFVDIEAADNAIRQTVHAAEKYRGRGDERIPASWTWL